MKNIFLVTSGLHGANGINGKLTVDTRIEQTISTAQSIRQQVPDAEILLLEGGKFALDLNLRRKLKMHYCDILDYTSSSFIQFAHNNVDLSKQDITVIKGPCETWMLLETVKLLDAAQQSRIFKISGRYHLNDNFDIKVHQQAQGKYLFKEKLEGLSWYGPHTGRIHSPWQYSTRLYSFCSTILPAAVNNYSTLLNKFMDIYSRQDYIDLEHLTYLTIDSTQIHTVPVMGLEGIFANYPDKKVTE